MGHLPPKIPRGCNKPHNIGLIEAADQAVGSSKGIGLTFFEKILFERREQRWQRSGCRAMRVFPDGRMPSKSSMINYELERPIIIMLTNLLDLQTGKRGAGDRFCLEDKQNGTNVRLPAGTAPADDVL
jgi:hypothetical protein